MKSFSILTALFFIAIFAIGTFCQTNNPEAIYDPCYAGRDAAGNDVYKSVKVGVEIQPNGFDSNVEAKMFVASAMNIQLKDPNVDYCLVPSVRGSERLLKASSKIRTIQSGYGNYDELVTGFIRMGVNMFMDPLLKKVFGSSGSKVKTIIQQDGGKYVNTPRVYFRVVEVTAETEMTFGKRSSDPLWEGSSLRRFMIVETRYSGQNGLPIIDIVSKSGEYALDDEVHNLVRIYGIKDLPEIQKTKPGRMPIVKNIGPMAEQVLKLLVTKEALQKDHIRLRQRSSTEQVTTGGGN